MSDSARRPPTPLQRNPAQPHRRRIAQRGMPADHRDTKAIGDVREVQVDRCIRALATLARGDVVAQVHGRVRQLEAGQRARVRAEHVEVEAEVIAQQAAAAEPVQELAHHLGDRFAAAGLVRGDAVVADRFDAEGARGVHASLEAFGQADAAVAHRHRCEAEDVVARRIDAGGFQVEADPLLRASRREQRAPLARAVPASQPPACECVHVSR